MKFELPGTDALGQVGKDAKRAGFHPWSRQQRPCPGAQRTGLACRLNFGVGKVQEDFSEVDRSDQE